MDQTLKIIIACISITITLIVVITGLVVKFTQNKKVKENAAKALQIINIVDKYVKDAEKLVNTPGIEKKKIVEGLVKKAANDLGIEYNEKQVSDAIESVVAIIKKEKTNEIN